MVCIYTINGVNNFVSEHMQAPTQIIRFLLKSSQITYRSAHCLNSPLGKLVWRTQLAQADCRKGFKRAVLTLRFPPHSNKCTFTIPFLLYQAHQTYTHTKYSPHLCAKTPGQQCVSSETRCAKSMAASSHPQWAPPFHWLPPSAAKRLLNHLWGCVQWAKHRNRREYHRAAECTRVLGDEFVEGGLNVCCLCRFLLLEDDLSQTALLLAVCDRVIACARWSQCLPVCRM